MIKIEILWGEKMLYDFFYVNNVKLKKKVYDAVFEKWEDKGIAHTVSESFTKSGLILLVQRPVDICASRNLEIYAQNGSIEGVIAAVGSGIDFAYANNKLCKIYVPTDEYLGKTMVTVLYNPRD